MKTGIKSDPFDLAILDNPIVDIEFPKEHCGDVLVVKIGPVELIYTKYIKEFQARVDVTMAVGATSKVRLALNVDVDTAIKHFWNKAVAKYDEFSVHNRDQELSYLQEAWNTYVMGEAANKEKLDV